MEYYAMQRQFTVGEVLKFIIRYRRNKAFRDWSYGAIYQELFRAARSGALRIVCAGDSILGICIAYENADGTSFSVDQILCIDSGFRTLLQHWKTKYPNHILVYERRYKSRALHL